MRLDRRLASLLLITGTMLGSGVALAPAPALAAVVTAAPSTFANTVTAQQVVFTVGTTNAELYALTGGANVTLTGPGAGTDTYADSSAVVDTSGGTVTATLNLVTAGLPAAPGSYAVSITNGLNISLDTSSVTVTNAQPTVSGSASLQPGTTAPITITATAGKFAKGDAVSIAPGTGSPSGGVTITGVAVGPTTITGTLHAAADAGAGLYDVVVTDTASGHASCADCVDVITGPDAVTGLTASNVTSTGATLSWTPAPGGTTATGYQVVVSTNPTKKTTDAGITVTHTGTNATATVTGLKAATEYHATVTPTSSIGPGTPASIPFFTTEPSFLTFSHTKANITYGTLLTLSGNLSTTGDAPLALKPIKLFQKVGAITQPLKTVKTTADGNYSYTFKPQTNAQYIAYYSGQQGTASSAAIAASLSKPFSSTVAQRVTLVGTPKHHGLWLQLSGKVAPDAAGRTVVIYKKANGHETKFATARVIAGSTYQLVRKHLKSGHYVLFATIKGTVLNAEGKSQKLTVNRP